MNTPSPRIRSSSRPQISRAYVEKHRRARYVRAAAELLHEFGREGPTVTNIVRLAGTARNSFYDVFSGAEECIAYGITMVVEELFATLDDQDAGDWPVRVHQAIAGFYGTVASDPVLAELFLIHATVSRLEDGRAAARSGSERFVSLFGRGRDEAEARGRRTLPATTEEYLSRAVVSLAAGRVRGAEVSTLPAESRGMSALVVGFYLGPKAADRILREPARVPVETGRGI